MAVQTVIKKRRDTAANWTSVNPILAAGEEGYESDTGKSKTGNGTSTWTALAYGNAGGAIPQSQVTDLTTDLAAKAPLSYPTFPNDVTISSTSQYPKFTIKSTNAAGYGIVSYGRPDGNGFEIAYDNANDTLAINRFIAGAYDSTPIVVSSTGALVVNSSIDTPFSAGFVKSDASGILSSAAVALDELSNVDAAAPTNKQVLQYETATSLWKSATISAGAAVGDTPPASPSANDIWWDSVSGRAYIYYDSFWVELSPGVVGPQGPVGPAGPTGPQGPAVTSMNASAVVTTVTDKSANYAITSADKNTYIRSTGSAITVTIDNVLAIGESVNFIQAGSGQITFAAGAGVTLLSADSLLKTAKQYAGATVTCGASGVYYLIGNLG